MIISAVNSVTEVDLPNARLGQRFGRMDLTCQLALLAVEPLATHFESVARERIAIVLAARAGSLPTDVEYWRGHDGPGGPRPTLFTYTLPSAAIGELAIRHRITGPDLCFVGGCEDVLPEATNLMRRGEAEACVCVYVNVISPALAAMISQPTNARACALFLHRDGPDPAGWPENDRDMEALCARLRPNFSTK